MKKFPAILILGLLLYGCVTTYDTSFAEYIEGDCTNGQWTITYARGDKYVGEWKNSKQHGQGTYTWADGTVVKGIFKKDKLVKKLN